jgi:hypothetical protein
VILGCRNFFLFVYRNWSFPQLESSIRPKTYVDAMKGKIVISQLYEQVNMQKSSRKCKTLARAKQYRLLHPTEGWQKRGGTTMYLLHRSGSTCFAAFLQIHKCLRLYMLSCPSWHRRMFWPIPRSSRALPSRRGSGVERTSDQHLQAFATEVLPPAGNEPGSSARHVVCNPYTCGCIIHGRDIVQLPAA